VGVRGCDREDRVQESVLKSEVRGNWESDDLWRSLSIRSLYLSLVVDLVMEIVYVCNRARECVCVVE
jgi:anti-sigma-K factor RskA